MKNLLYPRLSSSHLGRGKSKSLIITSTRHSSHSSLGIDKLAPRSFSPEPLGGHGFDEPFGHINEDLFYPTGEDTPVGSDDESGVDICHLPRSFTPNILEDALPRHVVDSFERRTHPILTGAFRFYLAAL